jgi:hypothetical protein
MMQQVYRDLEQVRAQALERIDALWARVASDPVTLH